MLSTNVLCIKKRKKRSYCIANRYEYAPATDKAKRSASGAATMLHITEDTPPDMLAGAMDLTVHLPTGRSVKMSVERSTPMMDLLVQVTTNHHLQLSGYTLQALGMAPSTEHSDKILPYKPNTPIGALDTQHIKVIPKARSTGVPKNVAPGRQPFESTFRLKVHLPRNQLYVTRVSQSVHLADIMKKVCEEKNLDAVKYEFRHPGNPDQTLDPKLSLSDYQITEVYIVLKGTVSLNQAFSTTDIMALRKEEERKQMHTKTGGGVFNLIFRRGNKSSSGSLSSENRSISPTHSDDSRSVTPPAVQQQIIAPPQPEPPVEKPKPPQRKRRPAPKPPQQDESRKNSTEQLPPEPKKADTTLICHSRNSSDSSGYHEASILSDNCNTSLPRRPKSAVINEEATKLLGEHSQSTSNLSKMSAQSKSTSSLAFPNRKKKSAPPPPPLKSAGSVTNLEKPSPVVASQPPAQESDGKGSSSTNPVPAPRTRSVPPPASRPRHLPPLDFTKPESNQTNHLESPKLDSTPGLSPTAECINLDVNLGQPITLQKEELESILESSEIPSNEAINESIIIDSLNVVLPLNNHDDDYEAKPSNIDNSMTTDIVATSLAEETKPARFDLKSSLNEEKLPEANCVDFVATPESDSLVKEAKSDQFDLNENSKKESSLAKEAAPVAKKVDAVEDPNGDLVDHIKINQLKLLELQKQTTFDIFGSKAFVALPITEEKAKPPEIVGVITKAAKKQHGSRSMLDSYSRKRGFQIGKSLLDQNSDDEGNLSSSNMSATDLSSMSSVTSALNAFGFVDEIDDLDVELFTGSLSKNSKNANVILNQLHGMHELETLPKVPSASSLRSVHSLPGFLGNTNMKKWDNSEELDDISLHDSQNKWVIGDTSDTESLVSTNLSNLESLEAPVAKAELNPVTETKQEDLSQVKETQPNNEELESDWQYQLPSPPKAFRDSSPVAFTDDVTRYESADVTDSVVTSPELFEKLKVIKDIQSEKETVSDLTSVVSEEEKPILNTLSLEHLEKRKSLVYNRELATSLKMSDDAKKETFSSSLTQFEKTYEEVRRSSQPKEIAVTKSTLPNFKITTYDNPKQKLNIFEDDTVRSNTESSSKRNSITATRRISESMENVSFRKHSLDDDFKKPMEYKFYRPQPRPKSQYVSVLRSESFSTDQNNWTPSKPVTRSKSQVALNKYKEEKPASLEEDSLSKSNSLFDVSGLQSLGVMRLIQNKLNTPSGSMEELDEESHQRQPEIKNEVQIQEKLSHYVPPSINMGTWSERPKIPVNVKDDPDYKISNKDVNSKLIVNTTNNDIKSNNCVEVRNQPNSTPSFNNKVNVRVNSDNRNVSIKVNGSEPISGRNTGNVVIKIGEQKPQLYRKPLGNINKVETNQRLHSIAFGNDFDISRVPIVRSVEFKKPYKDLQNNNTSVTQIYQNNKFSNGYRSNETLPTKPPVEPKPVFRLNSFVQNSAPVVRGFRSDNQRWSQPHSFSTLPPKMKEVAKPPTFPQVTLRRTESSKPPAPPTMPKVAKPAESYGGDPKEQLLQAIRDFGGKKGLRTVKA